MNMFHSTDALIILSILCDFEVLSWILTLYVLPIVLYNIVHLKPALCIGSCTPKLYTNIHSCVFQNPLVPSAESPALLLTF